MNTIGRVKVDGVEYFLHLRDTKKEERLFLFSKQHIDDRALVGVNAEATHVTIQEPKAVYTIADDGYLVESLKRLKVSGKFSQYRSSAILEKILSSIAYASTYRFAKSNIIREQNYMYMSDMFYDFEARDSNLAYKVRLENGLRISMSIHTKDFSLELTEDNSKFVNFKLNDIKYVDLIDRDRKRISVSSIKDVTFEDLRNLIDLSWFYTKEEGFKVEFKEINTIYDFETKVINEIIREAIRRKKLGLSALDLVLDTETTGFNMYNLSDDNEDKDRVVAIPICWDLKKSYVIFTDMEHFKNIPNEYVIRRLTELLENFKGTKSFTMYEPRKDNSADKIGLDDLKAFTLNVDKSGEITKSEESQYTDLNNLVPVVIDITRDLFNVAGHNSMFDVKALYTEAVKVFKSMSKTVYFNEDTLQMAFNLNPGFTKNSRGLKALTHRILKIETPELSTILGKGNEDKYRYLKDLQVALVYGCSDGLFTLKILKYLRSITTKKMYNWYKRLDIPMINILAISEYYGLKADKEALEKLAQESYENIEKLKDVVYGYTGMYISYMNQRRILDNEYANSNISEQEYKTRVANLRSDPRAVYRFDFKASQIRTILYDVMNYPIKGYTSGKKPLPKVDKVVMEKLAKEKLKDGENPINKLKNNIYVVNMTEEKYQEEVAKRGEDKCKHLVLVNAEEFNKAKYPLALIMQKYGDLYKEYTSYFKPMLEGNMEGKIFKNYSMARIETRRIMNPSQTMKGKLKSLILPYSDQYFNVDFDMSQVEYRIMLSISKFQEMIIKMNNPENDYHIETASLVNFKPAHMVTKDERKKTKNVSFGVPYGLGDYKLCERLFGVINDITLQATRNLRDKWEKANAPVVAMLEHERDKALTPREITEELRDFIDMWERDENNEFILDSEGKRIPIPVGFAEDLYGFYRIFVLKDLDDRKIASIRNAAGNFPIQCFAAELFRKILIRFYDRCTEEGIQDKIIWHMLIHDELLLSAHKSLHPFYLFKIIKESCMISLPGHTTYFVGINIGNSWAETKDDAREAPVYFVDRIIKRWDAGEFKDDPQWFDDPWKYIKPYRDQYVEDRIGEVLAGVVQKDIKFNPINVPLILDRFKNYTVRAYVNDYPMNFKVTKDYNPDDDGAKTIYDNRCWASRLESWALKVFGEDKDIIDFDGNLRKLGDLAKEQQIIKEMQEMDEEEVFEEEDVFIDYSELFEDDIHSASWSFDESEANEAMNDTTNYDVEDDYQSVLSVIDDSVYYASEIKSLAQLVSVERKVTKYVKKVNSQVIVSTLTKKQESIVKAFVAANKAVSGFTVYLKNPLGGLQRLGVILKSSDLDKLDEDIDKA